MLPLRLRSAVVIVASTLPIASIACSIGEDRVEIVKLAPVVKTQVKTCDSPLAKPDPASLKACGDGKKAHCYDKSKLPIPDGQLTLCDDPSEACVPDTILLAGGKKLKSCTFFMGDKPGACASLLFKQVSDMKEMMKQDVCDADERCAPCISPLDGSSTHLCDDDGSIGPHEQACTGGPGPGADVAPCCHGMGVCMNEEGAPPDQKGHMEREACPEKHLCAPASLANNKPVPCDVLGLSGVCLDLCFAAMFQATTQVTRSSCGPTEMCMPCAAAAMQGMRMPGCT